MVDLVGRATAFRPCRDRASWDLHVPKRKRGSFLDFVLCFGGSWQKLLGMSQVYFANGSDQWVINVITCLLNLSNPLLTSWGHPSGLVLKKMWMPLTLLKKKCSSFENKKCFFQCWIRRKDLRAWLDQNKHFCTIQLRQTAFGMYLKCVVAHDFGWPAYDASCW